MASPDLIWQCVRDSSSFIVKRKNREIMTKEPGNLTGINCFKYSGLASKNVLDVVADVKKIEKRKEGDNQIFRERICLVKSGQKAKAKLSPKRLFLRSRVPLNKATGMAKIKAASVGSFYRPDLAELASLKYFKICKSFEKRVKKAPTSRRQNNKVKKD